LVEFTFRGPDVTTTPIDAGAILFEFIEGAVVLDEEEDDEGGADTMARPTILISEGFVAPEIADRGEK